MMASLRVYILILSLIFLLALVEKSDGRKSASLKRLNKHFDGVEDERQYELSTEDGEIYTMSLLKNDLINNHPVAVETPNRKFFYAPQDCHYQGVLINKRGDVIMNDCENDLTGTIFPQDEAPGKVLTLIYDGVAGQHYLQQEDGKQAFDIPLNEVDEKLRLVHPTPDQKRGRRSADTIESSTKYISMAIVADSTFFNDKMRKSLMASMNYIYAVANHVDHIFKSANVRVALTELELWTDDDKFNVTNDIYENLKKFEGYNRDTLTYGRKWKHDNAHFLTGKYQQNGYRGLGAVGSLCFGFSSAVSYVWSDNPALTAGTVAHELGHNLGLYHLSDKCKCSRPPCVMNAFISYTPVNGLSSCAVERMKQKCAKGGCLCILDHPKKIMGGPVCGNGFQEAGEDCDCGRPKYCTNSCCDPYTCKKKTNAQCASGKCCENCQIRRNGAICRKSAGECDISEHCDGYSSECPENVFLNDFTSCNKNEGYCHKGVCSLSLSEQCKSLWGPNARHGSCQINENFMNMRGTKWGNCGTTQNGFKQCRKSDVNCGKLQCYGEKLSPFILLGQSRRTMKYYVNGGTKCVTGTTNMGKDAGDITLAKPGTKCGENKVCYEQHCLEVSAIMNTFHSRVVCDNRCGKNGFCTNKGKCYCKPGFKCPDCLEKDSTNIEGRLCKAFSNTGKNKPSTGCPNDCSSNGVCEAGKNHCFCFNGWKCPDCKQADSSNTNGQSCRQTNTPTKVITCSGSTQVKLKSVGCSAKLQNKFNLVADLRSKIDWNNYQTSLSSIICECASQVDSRGWKAFGIQFWGECWGNPSLAATINKSSLCKNTKYERCTDGIDICTGEEHSAYLYELL